MKSIKIKALRPKRTTLNLVVACAAASALNPVPAKAASDSNRCDAVRSTLIRSVFSWAEEFPGVAKLLGDDASMAKLPRVTQVSTDARSAVCEVDFSIINYLYANEPTKVDLLGIRFQYDATRRSVWPLNLPTGCTAQEWTAFDKHFFVNGVSFLTRVAYSRSKQTRQEPSSIDATALLSAMAEEQRDIEAAQRSIGLGPLLDAEAQRRAKLTPAERAREDTYNAGPAQGETICIEQNGVRRCKSRL